MSNLPITRIVCLRTSLPVLFVLVLTAASVANADRADFSDAAPIRNPLNWRAERHHVTPTFGFSVNDEYTRALSAGLSYRYYFNNWIGVGVDFMATYVSLDTGLTEQIEAKLTQPGQTGRPSLATPEFLVTASATFVPIYGKMMWFGSLPVAYDIHFLLGAGMATIAGEGRIDDSVTWTPMVGVGTRLFFSDWIAVEMTLRDYIIEYAKAAPAAVTAPKEEFEQHLMFTVGISFVFPPDLSREL